MPKYFPRHRKLTTAQSGTELDIRNELALSTKSMSTRHIVVHFNT